MLFFTAAILLCAVRDAQCISQLHLMLLQTFFFAVAILLCAVRDAQRKTGLVITCTVVS